MLVLPEKLLCGATAVGQPAVGSRAALTSHPQALRLYSVTATAQHPMLMVCFGMGQQDLVEGAVAARPILKAQATMLSCSRMQRCGNDLQLLVYCFLSK